MKFVHLHNHTDYSLLDGAITVDNLVASAVKMGMPGIAVTDHGNMFGAIEFYLKAVTAGIKPIIGQEFYVAPDSLRKKEGGTSRDEDKASHLLILAENSRGYSNLMSLSSTGYIDGFYYKPRIDLQELSAHSEGLICASACIAGQIPRYILSGQSDKAMKYASDLKDIFGRDRFYLELQDHGLREQKIVNKELIRFSSALDIPLIATNDAHYVSRDDAYAHEVLLCIQTGKTMKDEGRMKFGSDEFYLKTPEEMFGLFPDNPEALLNTFRIHEMVDLKLELGNPILPHFEVPEKYNLDSYLRELVYDGASRRYGAALPEKITDRIEYELAVITKMKFSGYFLIVWDLIKYARSINIPVGPGRGSAAGSIVSYCLGITSLDPLKYDLLFERFLNPDRNEMPDMDLDFCADRREEVIDYVRTKYGDDKVSQIITFNKMKAKAVVKDVARALDIPFQAANNLSKYISEKTLAESIKVSKELQELINKQEYGKELVNISLRLEGLARSAGKHAAGVVISRSCLTDFVPLYRDSREGAIMSQFEKTTLEKAGLVKMDFLGLKNLSIIDKCLKLIKKSRGEDLDIEHIPLDDEATFQLLQRADTKGIFQLESSGMHEMLRRLKPTCFEDIIAIVALYRPGPLKSGMADDFIERKRNPEKISYPHKILEPVLRDTLGVIVYQEQVMRISQLMGGFSLSEADKLRKAMGKKEMSIIDGLESKFLEGAAEKNIDPKLAFKVYSVMREFGEYGFNKSHSAAYALVTYQTAYLKSHYAPEYMTSLLSAQEDVVPYINDCRYMGIKILPPCINRSFFSFNLEGDSIRFGLGAVKGLGEKAIEGIISEREKKDAYRTLRDFLESVPSATLNSGVLEALIKSGAFDSLYPNRAALFRSLDYIADEARRLGEQKLSGQGNLFDSSHREGAREIEIPQSPEWKENEKLAMEKDVLGLYLSGHPLLKYEKEISSFSPFRLGAISHELNEREIGIAGVISGFGLRRSKKNNREYGVARFEDLTGYTELIFFDRAVSQYTSLENPDEPVVLKGKVEVEDEKVKKIVVHEVRPLKNVRREKVSAVHIQLDSDGISDSMISGMKDIFARHRGNCEVYFHLQGNSGSKIVKVHNTYNICASEELVKDLSAYIDTKQIRYSMGLT